MDLGSGCLEVLGVGLVEIVLDGLRFGLDTRIFCALDRF